MTTKIIKPRKGLPLSFMAIILVVTISISWPISLFMLLMISVISLLLVTFFVDAYSGYLKLDKGILYRKSLLTTKSIKVSAIREVATSSSGVFPTSSLGAGTIDLGNAKDGYVSIRASGYKRDELIPLTEQLYSELKAINPKRAKDLQKAFKFL